jgi:hypothetical protein
MFLLSFESGLQIDGYTLGDEDRDRRCCSISDRKKSSFFSNAAAVALLEGSTIIHLRTTLKISVIDQQVT